MPLLTPAGALAAIAVLVTTFLGCATSAPRTASSAAAMPESAASNPPVSQAGGGQQAAFGTPRVFRILPEESEASYDIQEKLTFLPFPNRAVGRTNTIDGQFLLTMGAVLRVEDAQFWVDLRTLTSDQSRRDQFIRRQWLESNTYPMAQFAATRVEQLPGNYIEGQDVTVKITGDMTIRTTTREITFDARASMQGNTIKGTATTFLLMRDFGFDPPIIANLVSVEDGVNLTVNFTAQSES